MKLLTDFLPIALFFITFKLAGIYVATAVAIAATLLQIGWLYFRNGKVEAMQWVSLVIIVLFGGATLVFNDDTFIKWKPTVLYWLMGAALALGHLVFKRNFLQSLMGSQLELPAPVWLRLLWAWTGFFVLIGVLNLWVAYNFDLYTLVSYKLFGGMGLMLVFVVIQALYLSRFIKNDEAAQEETP